MVINRIHINRFGALAERDIALGSGLNIIEGENESGKTTVAAFIRFLFYGTENAVGTPFAESRADTAKSADTATAADTAMPAEIHPAHELARYLDAAGGTRSVPVGGWADITCSRLFLPDDNRAAGTADGQHMEDGQPQVDGQSQIDGMPHRYRVERTFAPADAGHTGTYTERCAVYGFSGTGEDAAPDTAHPLFVGAVPGEVFFGVNASAFTATAFVAQIVRTRNAVQTDSESESDAALPGETDGNAIRAAIDRILYAADEALDPVRAAAALTEKRNALFNPETGRGSIADLERRRDALEAAAAERADTTEAAAVDDTEADAPETDAPDAEVPAEDASSEDGSSEPDVITGAERAEDSPEAAALKKSIAEFEENKRVKEARTEKLRMVYDAYSEYASMKEADKLPELMTRRAAAEKRAAALTKTMFRGNYVPDGDFAASLHLCAEDLKTAQADLSAAHAEEEKLAFSVRRDNFKENRLRRVSLDGGADSILAHLDRLRTRRSVMTVGAVIFLLAAVFLLAMSVFLLVLHTDIGRNLILLTALLGTVSGFFFFIRARYEKGIGVMFARYGCSTEDELENFLEEFKLTEQKLLKLDRDKEALREKTADASLRASEAGRQAALLLSRLQPPGVQKLTADRLNPEIIEAAAGRIDRTLAEIARQKEQAAACEAETERILASHHAETAEALLARRDLLKKRFGGTDAEAFDTEPLLREMDFNIKACAAIDARLGVMREQLHALTTGSGAADTEMPDAEALAGDRKQKGDHPASQPVPAPAKSAAACAPDPALIRGMLDQMDAQLRRDRRQYAAYTLAINALQRASERLHAETAPRLTAGAGRLMRLLTGEKWNTLALDDEMHLVSAAQDGSGQTDAQTQEALSIDRLSAGTQELAYFSVRIALLQMLYKKELPPMIFDEAFATLDDKRLARMIALLLKLSAGGNGQALVFTCHKRERRAAEAIGRCHVVKMELRDPKIG